MKAVRRVVTGQDRQGRARIVSDAPLDPVEVFAGSFILPIWASDEIPSFPQSGVPPRFEAFFPPAGGYRFIIMSMPPGDTMEKGLKNPQALPAPAEQRLGAGMQDVLEPEGTGMHRTDTVDLEYVISGEPSLAFDDGEIVHLNAGDCFIQNGTRHRWFNRGSTPIVVLVVLVGGHSRPGEPPAHCA